MRKLFFALLLSAVSGIANAGLIGDSVNVELRSNGSTSFGARNNLIVGVGEEANYFSNQFINFDDYSFSVRSTSSFSSIDGPGGTIEWVLSGLDFGTPLQGVTFTVPYSNVFVSAMTANSITFSYTDIAIPAGTYFAVQFLTGPQQDVPEPAILALLGIGLLGLTVRRKQSV